MQDTLLLTAAERKTFDALPASLQADWKVQPETGTAYETDYQLMIRANMAELDAFPAMKQAAAELRAGRTPDLGAIGTVPDEAIPEVLFSIGARGISVMVDLLLSRAKSDEELRAAAGLTFFRHDILESNAKFVPSSR